MHTVSQACTNTFLYSNVCGDGGEQKSKKRERMCVCVCMCQCEIQKEKDRY